MGSIDWRRADAELLAARADEKAAQAAQLEWIPIAEEAGAHLALGFATFHEYLRKRLGLGKQAARDRIRMARELQGLPKIRAALAEGTLTMCGVRELTRVVIDETESAWLEVAVGQTVDTIQKLVSGLSRGDLPGTPPDPAKVTSIHTYELENEAVALLRQARLMLERTLESSLSDSQFFAELAKRTIADLQAGTAAKPLHKKVVVNSCPDCDSVHQLAAGEWIRIDPRGLTDLDLGDALVMPLTHVGYVQDGDDIPKPVRDQVFVRDHGRCVVPGCTGTHYLHWHHITYRSQGGPDEAWNIVLLCSSHHAAHHRGLLRIRGLSARDLTFFHSDGSPYGLMPVIQATQ